MAVAAAAIKSSEAISSSVTSLFNVAELMLNGTQAQMDLANAVAQQGVTPDKLSDLFGPIYGFTPK